MKENIAKEAEPIELIIHFNDYLDSLEIKKWIKPILTNFQIKETQDQPRLRDFVVVKPVSLNETVYTIDEIRGDISKLSCVKTTSFNRKIKGNLSSLINLHDSYDQSIFRSGVNGGTRDMKGKDPSNQSLRRELFLKGEYINLYDEFDLWKYHEQGFTGKGVKVAIFDSGISTDAIKHLNIAAKIDFTNDSENNDMTSHGTFIASVIGSRHARCPGIAPDAELYIFKVFNKDHNSYTEWFLKAFNYAIEKGIDIINLSNGSSDFKDSPFIDKINEIVGKGITVVSSIGNDGPDQGTLNNPADMVNVIGVGSLNYSKDNLAIFSSRGITTWNLLKEVGIIKPDVVTLGEKVSGLDLSGVWTVSSGTSVSSGIISGSLALIVSSMKNKPNPAIIKSAILQSSNRLPLISISDQGNGVFDIDDTIAKLNSADLSLPYIFPTKLDLTSPEYLPFSLVSFYSSMMPISFNFTVINPINSKFEIEEIKSETSDLLIKEWIKIEYEYSAQSIPYYSQIRTRLSVISNNQWVSAFVENGQIDTFIKFKDSNYTSKFSIVLKLIPTPERYKRILIDSFHNLKFPEDGYVLRDSIFVDKHPYEWKGDHVFTNYMKLYKYLIAQGYYVEVLNESIICFDSQSYGTFILADPEKALTKQEVNKLQKDIEQRGLSLIVLAEWSEQSLISKHTFSSEFYKKTWNPLIGGWNLKSINTLLHPYGISFKESSYSGSIVVGNEKFKIESGSIIGKFPNKGFLFSGKLTEDSNTIKTIDESTQTEEQVHPMVGVYDISDENSTLNSGSILVFGDSYWIESSSTHHWFKTISEFLKSLQNNDRDSLLFSEEHKLVHDFDSYSNNTNFEKSFREETDIWARSTFFNLKDEMESGFSIKPSNIKLNVWRITDEDKYLDTSDDKYMSMSFKYEILTLWMIAIGLVFLLFAYIWYQRKKNIRYMRVAPDIDII